MPTEPVHRGGEQGGDHVALQLPGATPRHLRIRYQRAVLLRPAASRWRDGAPEQLPRSLRTLQQSEVCDGGDTWLLVRRTASREWHQAGVSAGTLYSQSSFAV